MSRLLILIFQIFGIIAVSAQSKSNYVIVGSYAKPESKGLHVCKFDDTLGTLSVVSEISNVDNPTYVVVSPDNKYLYAVNETDTGQGSISAFLISKKTGELSFLNKVSSEGSGPCFIDIDKSGKWLVAGNYNSGSFSVFKTNNDGSLSTALQTVAHKGKGVNTTRQEKSHIHCTQFSPDGRFVVVVDLGTNQIFSYPFDRSTPTKPINAKKADKFTFPDGYGPRHVCFHPSRAIAYVMNELSGNVSVFKFTDGEFDLVEHTPAELTKEELKFTDKGGADIHITPDGKYLYTTTRGTNDDISFYTISPMDGKLKFQSRIASNGKEPRNFTISPNGKFLLVGNRASDNISIFKIDKKTGQLTMTENVYSANQPVCLRWAKF